MENGELDMTKREIDDLISILRDTPHEQIGEHLSDNEFIRYVMGDLSEQELLIADEHLNSCDECVTEMERLLDAYEVWQTPLKRQHLHDLEKHCALVRTLYQATEDWKRSSMLVASDKANHKIWEWQNDIFHISVNEDANGNWTFWFSSSDLSYENKHFRLHLASVEREIVLKKVAEGEVGAKVVISGYERPSNISGILFDTDEEDFSIQTDV